MRTRSYGKNQSFTFHRYDTDRIGNEKIERGYTDTRQDALVSLVLFVFHNKESMLKRKI
jgi:hypothetical protein